MPSLSWTAALVPLLAAVARTSGLAAVSPAEDPPPRARLAFVPIVSHVPDNQLSFEDYAATNNLGDGGQFYSSGHRDPRGRPAYVKKRAKISPDDSHVVKFPARSRRSPALSSSPALDTVDDPSSHWSILSHADKPRFVTSKGGRAQGSTSSPARSGADAKLSAATDVANPSSNEIPRSDEAYQLRYDASRDYLYRDLTPVDDFAMPPPPQQQQQPRKRIIYYANLPEVVRHGPGYAPPRVYDGYPGFRPTDVNKYPRESRFDYGPAPVAISSGDRFTYVPGGRTTYTIIDATPPGYYDTGNRY
ncbi:hypothetical protein PR048_015804 [Dryococelus australis]|uniref:Uncharacterized protein n=1 Tax=Dryococelus australis TaxID=614101 RepID=A0ABQ9HHZ0_9NEOP|nr:hypothetical protein PR048_015804 [Dryococelus australis]